MGLNDRALIGRRRYPVDRPKMGCFPRDAAMRRMAAAPVFDVRVVATLERLAALKLRPAAMVPPGVRVRPPFAVAVSRAPRMPRLAPGVATRRCVSNFPAGVAVRPRTSRNMGLEALPILNLGPPLGVAAANGDLAALAVLVVLANAW